MQIQNGRHEITKLIIFALIIGIETILFYQTMFSISRNTMKNRYFISLYYHAKFKMAAMKSLNHIFIINRDRADIISPNLMLSI